MADDDWWFNLNTRSAEQDAQRGKAADRLGPYGSREEAERALDKVAERNEAADREDDWGDEDD
ncbi:MAG: SPOR domain-containing protein [Propionibacteriaceae bacterium]